MSVVMGRGQVVGEHIDVDGLLVREVPMCATVPGDSDAASGTQEEPSSAAPAHVGVNQQSTEPLWT